MKIKEGFSLREIGGDKVVLATENASMLLNGIIKLNETGALLWEQISTNCSSEEQLADYLCSKYNISSKQAQNDVAEFVNILRSAKCIEE